MVTKPSTTEVEVEDSGGAKSSGRPVQSIENYYYYSMYINLTAVNVSSCPSCGKSIPKDDFKFHSHTCSKPQLSATVQKSTAKGGKIQPSVAQKKGQPKKESDDLDTMLAEMTLLDSSCSLQGCKKKVNLLGLQCHLCCKRFCMEHNIPETHGCSEAAKKYARQAVKPRSTATSKDASRRAQLHKKLESKLEELSSDRKSKTKSKS